MFNPHPSQVLTSDVSLGSSFTLLRGQSLVSTAAGDCDAFVLIETGALLMYGTNGAGERFHLSIIGNGYVFTPQSIRLSNQNPARFGIEAMRDVTFRRITSEQWHGINQRFPSLYNWVIEQEAQQLHIVQFHLAQHVQRSSLDRARFALCTYAQGLGSLLPCGSKSIKVSRAELATWIGVSSDRMARLIRELHGNGEVTLSGRSIKVSSGLLTSHYPTYT
ncbi:Crp/Fnr family transcriptional regulator [Pseudomonas syringae pv. actinidiae]|nr:Crp/Fnr family transcriptional regulator [Pseudomonas syringae pv. actinidiae]